MNERTYIVLGVVLGGPGQAGAVDVLHKLLLVLVQGIRRRRGEGQG
jgi:hypothetical protein